ncbi:unnamed protein product [Paramecium pentaurelia]|uniref:NAD-dependent epimerase/dehydratase domain-containing protein n=1 Tax=Paramecium pentaurelia TaxID=43138 RepID=A0A8S1ULN5_9CILI|nr:unnamed protein product [Paramecium pentaurelia]
MKKLILVLGGSTFMGKELLQDLSQNESYEVHYINRGKNYWNNAVNQIKNIYYTYGNREDTNDFTTLLRYLQKKLNVGIDGRKWEAVIDFSAFYSNQVKSVYAALRGLCNLYIFISTDSIYDVCKIKEIPITEDQDQRKDLQESQKKRESYGHNKLKCEEFLKNYVIEGSFRYVILRLPDVIGPFDDSGRFFALVKWLKQNDKYPIQVDQVVQSEQISLVYSTDVVNCIKYFIQNIPQQNQIYNVCFDETISYIELAQVILNKISDKQLNIKHVTEASKFYPSVDCGVINNKKIKELGIQFTPLMTALDKTIDFFLKEAHNYEAENKAAIDKLNRKLNA